MADTDTLTIASDSDHEDEMIEVPRAAIDALARNDESPTEMAGDLVMLGLAQQLHGTIYHSDQPTPDAVEEANEELGDAFEERFGMSFEEMAGHEH